MKKICVIGGTPLYRLPIYNQMAKVLNCDFYISGDDPQLGIVTYNKEDLLNFKGELATEKKVIGNFTWIGGMTRLFFKSYDVFVIGGPYNLNGWIMIFLSWFSNKKIASWSHGMYGKEKGVRKFIKILFYNLCNINFVYNERAVDLMKRSGISSENICVYNSLDTDKELCLRNKLSKSDVCKKLFIENYPIVIFVGRITSVKRLDLVIESMRILNERKHPINFLLVGKDVDNINLHNLVDKYGLKRQVHFYGPCYDEQILGQFFYNSDVCVSPGNVGLTAMSSMSFGCPTISHDDFSNQMPEFEAIKPGITGDFFTDGDFEDLADQIEKWTSISEEEREIVRNNCYNEIDARWNIYSETEAFKKVLM